MSGLILGIDQGASHTRAVVADASGRLLGLGRAAGACHTFDGMLTAMRAIEDAARQALAAAGAGPEDVAVVYAGLTGADWPDEYELLTREVAALGLSASGRVRVTNDCMVALAGGTEQPYGAILVAGSGANCAVRSPAGDEFIYGYYHDDDLQGGVALGRAVLAAIYRGYGGHGPATALAARVLAFYRFREMDELRRAHVERRLDPPPKELAPLLFEEAWRGDRVAAGILRAFAEGCAGLVTAALARFDMTSLPVDVVLSGGIFKARGSLLLEALAAGIHAAAPQARLVQARYEPVVGAALLGLEELRAEPSAAVRRNVDESARRLGLVRSSATS